MSQERIDTVDSSSTEGGIGLRPVVEGEFAPTGFAVAPGEHGRAYVLDQRGHDERGLLGLAFHPDYEHDRRCYVRYSAPPREGTPGGWDHTDVAEFEATDDGARVDPDAERTVMELPHPHLHHVAGDLAFGPDGYLYVGTGDGGHTGDVGPGHVEGGNDQDVTENLLGSILRVDVDAGFDRVYLHQTGPNQEAFIDFAEREFVPEVG